MTVMKKITDYCLCDGGTAQELNENISSMIDVGFEPVGQPFCDAEGVLYQAVVKYQYYKETPMLGTPSGMEWMPI